MDNYDITFKTWNKVAELYQQKFMDLALYDDTYDAFCEQFPKAGPKVLEIGCGPGNITKYLHAKRPDFRIKGIDVAPNMVELARKNNPMAIFEVMDVRTIGQLTEKFDGIVCGFCLPYLSQQDISKMIVDCKVLLLEKGILYLSFVEGEAKMSGFQTSSSGDKVYFYYHQEESLAVTLKENGFEVIRLQHKEYERKDGIEIHTVLVARKF